MTKDFNVGQTVWVEVTGNASRGRTVEECIEEWEITSVGRKYIKAGRRHKSLGILNETVFEYRDNYKRFVQKADCCVNYILYLTRQEIEEKHEKSQLFLKIIKWFNFSSERDISLEQLRLIYEILQKKDGE